MTALQFVTITSIVLAGQGQQDSRILSLPEIGLKMTLPGTLDLVANDTSRGLLELAEKHTLLRAYAQGEGDGKLYVFVTRLDGQLIHARITTEQMAKRWGSEATATDVAWRDLTLQGITFPTLSDNNQPWVVCSIGVPLKPHAVSINVFAQPANREAAFGMLKVLLAGIEGESNWVAGGGDETTVIENKEKGYKVVLPSVFVREDSAKEAAYPHGRFNSTIKAAFKREAKHGVMVVTVIEIDQPIIDEAADDKKLQEKYPNGTYLLREWRGIELKVIRNVEVVDGSEIVTYTVPVPLQPSAIVIQIVGDPKDEDDIDATMKSILGSLEGQVGWAKPGLLDRPIRVSDILIALGILYLISRLFRRRNRAPK